jgi:hypothetical protein
VVAFARIGLSPSLGELGARARAVPVTTGSGAGIGDTAADREKKGNRDCDRGDCTGGPLDVFGLAVGGRDAGPFEPVVHVRVKCGRWRRVDGNVGRPSVNRGVLGVSASSLSPSSRRPSAGGRGAGCGALAALVLDRPPSMAGQRGRPTGNSLGLGFGPVVSRIST